MKALDSQDGPHPAWVTRMLEAIGPEDPKDLRIEIAQAEKDPHLPERIYRYRDCTDYALQNLRGDTQWMSAPSAYNDPYDSAIRVDETKLIDMVLSSEKVVDLVGDSSDLSSGELETLRGSAVPMSKLLDIYVNRGNINSDIAEKLIKICGELLHREARKITNQLAGRLKDALTVCSFSEAYDSMLMWSHYANQHRGFCIEYDISTLARSHQKRLMLYPVLYGDHRFDATGYLRPMEEGFNNIFTVVACLFKARCWSYEREWRLIAPAIGLNSPGFNTWMPKPSRILLGARISARTDEKEQEILQIAEDRQIPVSRMRLADTIYRIEMS